MMPRTSSLISAVDSARLPVAVDRWPDITLNCSAICRPCTAIPWACSLIAFARLISGSSFCSESIDRFDGAIYKHRHRDHRPAIIMKRDGDDPGDDYQPEEWLVRVHSQNNDTLYLVLCTLFVIHAQVDEFNEPLWQRTKIKDQGTKYSFATLSFQVYTSAQRPCGRKAQSCASLRHKPSSRLRLPQRSNQPGSRQRHESWRRLRRPWLEAVS